MKKMMALVATLLAVGSQSVFASALSELSADQLKAVQSGQQVSNTVDAGAYWPKVYVYQKLDGAPAEGAAIFFDYAQAKNVFPWIKKSDISNEIDSTTTEVDYTLTDLTYSEDYTVRDKLTSYSAQDATAYKISWTMVKSESLDAIDGSIRFEALPMPDGSTSVLMAYYSFISPQDIAAKLVKGRAIQRVKDTASKIGAQLVKEKSQFPDWLKSQVQKLQGALGE
ncbi:MAG: hypothetical protein ACXVBW_12040 [Bdellovibrionota bacterium]